MTPIPGWERRAIAAAHRRERRDRVVLFLGCLILAACLIVAAAIDGDPAMPKCPTSTTSPLVVRCYP